MPGSNTPRPPAFQIHVWPGCQTRTSSFQSTRTLRDAALGQQRRAGSTPAAARECQLANKVERTAFALSTQRFHFVQRRARRFFEHHVQAVLEGFTARSRNESAAACRSRQRRAAGTRPAVRRRLEVGHAVELLVAACTGDQLEGGVARKRGHVLIACDLADTDECDAHGCQQRSERRRGRPRRRHRAEGIAQGQPERLRFDLEVVALPGRMPSANDKVAVPKKCTCTSPGRRNSAYLK